MVARPRTLARVAASVKVTGPGHRRTGQLFLLACLDQTRAQDNSQKAVIVSSRKTRKSRAGLSTRRGNPTHRFVKVAVAESFVHEIGRDRTARPSNEDTTTVKCTRFLSPNVAKRLLRRRRESGIPRTRRTPPPHDEIDDGHGKPRGAGAGAALPGLRS